MIRSCVIIENVSSEKRVFPLYTKLTIGRASSNDIPLSEPTVSKRHAALGRVRGLPVIKNLGSRNGIFVEGKRVEKAVLSNGDNFRVGKVSLRFIQDQENATSRLSVDGLEFQFQKRLGEYLVKAGIIKEFTLMPTIDGQQKKQTIGQILTSMGVVDDLDIAMALAKQLNLPFVRFDGFEIEQETLSLVPAAVARTNLLMPIKLTDKLHLAMVNPLDTEAVKIVRVTSGKNVEIAVSPERDLLETLERFYASDFMNQLSDAESSLDGAVIETK